MFNFVIDWKPDTEEYRLWSFDPKSADPLPKQIQHGKWPSITKGHQLIPIGNYILDWEPETGKYWLWNFDPQNTDPLPGKSLQSGKWSSIDKGHQLVPIENYILDWEPATGKYRLWNFDPQSSDPLPEKSVQSGKWSSIGRGHELIPIANYILDWEPATGKYRLWNFDPQSADPLAGTAVQTGTWSSIRSLQILIGVQSLIPIKSASTTGSMAHMRSKIKHVVYYMLENRSFDHVCGWLYEHDTPAQFIGNGQGIFNGTSTEYHNYDGKDKKDVHVSKYKNGELNEHIHLKTPTCGGYHDYRSIMTQLYGYSDKKYSNKQPPPMTGFIKGNYNCVDVMETYTPTQLPIVNGLAKHYAVSDHWFSSLPGPTDVNRAFSLTGSSYGRVTNFEGSEYPHWPSHVHRPSIWKVLSSNGFRDWKIYYFDEWQHDCYTYHLFLKNQVPTIDKEKDKYVLKIEKFLDAAKSGNLPKFSYIEPAWVHNNDNCPNSYHPSADLVPGEKTLNAIYNALLHSCKWHETLLVITFDEHGGLYDHVTPAYGARPYANDHDDGFHFDLFGVRVPTILISPWVEERTVFRSTESVAYDSTSFPATLLNWYGIPKQKWGLGERINHAPTFESVFTRATARTDTPKFTPPHDACKCKRSDIPVNSLHQLFASRTVWTLGAGQLDTHEIEATVDDILSKASNIEELHTLLTAFKEKMANLLSDRK